MNRSRLSSVISLLAGVVLAAPLALLGTSSAAGSEGQLPPVDNVRVVLGDHGFVDQIAWDAPGDGIDPLRYDVNYRYANEGPLGEQVFWWTRDTFLDSSTFGRFRECTPQDHPANQWVVWITYTTATGSSERSDTVSMCHD